MGSIFFDGYKLFKVCKDRIKEKQEMILDDKLWLLYLLELNNGYTGNYDDYKKSRIKPDKQSKNENSAKEQELINKYKNLDQTKFIQKRI